MHSIQITRAWFEEKEIGFIIRQRGQRESTSQSTVIPLLRENVHILKWSSGTQLDCMTNAGSPWALALILQLSSTTSLKQYVLAGRFLLWWSERNKG
jgi:hypothetical protein